MIIITAKTKRRVNNNVNKFYSYKTEIKVACSEATYSKIVFY